MLRFALIFLAVLLALFGLELLQPVQQHVVLPWTAALARFCVALVSWADASVLAQGKVIWSSRNGFGVSIEPGCNGVEAVLVLCAALVAFPASWRQRLYGLLVGFVAIQVLNVVRVISLFYLGQWSRPAFDFAHLYLWQGLIMLDVLVVYLLWLRWVAPRQPVPVAPAVAV